MMRNANVLALLLIATSTAAHPTLSIPFSDQLLHSSKNSAALSESVYALHFNPGVRVAPNRSFRISLRRNTFRSTTNTNLACEATLADNSALPPWLILDPTSLVFQGMTPPTPSSLNLTVACSDSSRSDPALDWFMFQVGSRSLELKRHLKPLEAMASNDVRFNTSTILEDVVIDGSSPMKEDAVNLTVSIEDANWLHWDR